VLKTKTFIKRR